MLHLPDRPGSVRRLLPEQTDRLGAPGRCPTCKGKGQFNWYAYASAEWKKAEVKARAEGRVLKPGQADQVREYVCPCDDQIVIHRYLDYWGVKLLYQRASERDIISVEARKAYVRVMADLDFSLETGTGLFIHGGHGLGKSLICALVAKEAVLRGMRPVRFGTFVDFINRWQATWHGHERYVQEKKLFEAEIRDVSLLVIDDLGKEALMANAPSIQVIHRMISELLRQRSQSELPTLISSNLDLDQAIQRYGTDVASILASFEVITLEGEDYRNDILERTRQEFHLGLTRPVMV
jgi:DNA replication protein DnaC